MAQAASFSIYPYIRDRMVPGKGAPFSVVLTGIDGTRFRKPVIPGDTVRMETVVTKKRGPLWLFNAKAFVEGQLVAETDLMASVTLL
jgi:3-hydroxyacyl-[acyl-carrier-protein] dehydratase